jgi:hypothetical protein
MTRHAYWGGCCCRLGGRRRARRRARGDRNRRRRGRSREGRQPPPGKGRCLGWVPTVPARACRPTLLARREKRGPTNQTVQTHHRLSADGLGWDRHGTGAGRVAAAGQGAIRSFGGRASYSVQEQGPTPTGRSASPSRGRAPRRRASRALGGPLTGAWSLVVASAICI